MTTPLGDVLGAGGATHYASLAYGPFVGFVAGFYMLAAGVVSVAALALASGDATRPQREHP